MSKGAGISCLCGTSRGGSYRGSQEVYGEYLNKCEDLRKNLTDWLKERNIELKPTEEPTKEPMGEKRKGEKRKIKFPLLSIMYLRDREAEQESIENVIQDLGFRGLLVLIHEDFQPSKHVEENVIRLVSKGKEIDNKIRQNEEEIWRMKRFIQEKANMLAFSYDRKNPDKMLQDAVKFIENELSLHLVDVKDSKNVNNCKGIKESPLVVFCKYDSQLQEDIDNAKRYARFGSDVMLLVLTTNRDMHLVDTKATEELGMKSQLIFSNIRNMFTREENQRCTMWLHKFLVTYGYNVSRKLSRSESLQLSFRQLTKRKETGFYEKLRSVSEEMEKSVVLYLEIKHNLFLQRMGDDFQESRPFILFCRDGESAEDDINQFIKEKQATSNLHMTVVLLSCKGQTSSEIPNMVKIQRLVIRSSQEPTILPIPANGRVANKVRDFFAKKSEQTSNNFQNEGEVTHRDMRGTAQERPALQAFDKDRNILEEKNRSRENFLNPDKKTAIPSRQEKDQGNKNVLNPDKKTAIPSSQEKDQGNKNVLNPDKKTAIPSSQEKDQGNEIVLNPDKKTAIPSSQEKDQGNKNVLNPALKTRMTSHDPAPSKDPKLIASKPSARRHAQHSAKERGTKNEKESNTRADTENDNQETLQAGFQEGQTSSFSQDTLHKSSRSLKDNDAHNSTPDAITEKSLTSESENEDMEVTQTVSVSVQKEVQ